MSLKTLLLTFIIAIPLIPSTAQASTQEYPVDTTNTLVALIAFVLGMIGSLYLAAELWERYERGSKQWVYLAISITTFALWNVIMASRIVLNILVSTDTTTVGTFGILITILNALDPLAEVITFTTLFFGLKRIITIMRNEPWAVFTKEEKSDE